MGPVAQPVQHGGEAPKAGDPPTQIVPLQTKTPEEEGRTRHALWHDHPVLKWQKDGGCSHMLGDNHCCVCGYTAKPHTANTSRRRCREGLAVGRGARDVSLRRNGEMSISGTR